MDAAAPSPDEPLPWERIIAKATHDMKTPLSSIRVTLEILRMTCGGAEAPVKLVAMIDSQVNELVKLLETLENDPVAILSR